MKFLIPLLFIPLLFLGCTPEHLHQEAKASLNVAPEKIWAALVSPGPRTPIVNGKKPGETGAVYSGTTGTQTIVAASAPTYLNFTLDCPQFRDRIDPVDFRVALQPTATGTDVTVTSDMQARSWDVVLNKDAGNLAQEVLRAINTDLNPDPHWWG